MKDNENCFEHDGFSRNRSNKEHSKNNEGTSKENEQRSSKHDDSLVFNEQKLQKTPERLNKEVQLTEQQIIHFLYEEKAWTGLLPDPDSFNKYDKCIRDRMVDWNSQIIDCNCSRLMDDSRVFSRSKLFSDINSLVVSLGALFGSLLMFYLTNYDPISLVFLGLPAINVGINLLIEHIEVINQQESESDKIHYVWKSK